MKKLTAFKVVSLCLLIVATVLLGVFFNPNKIKNEQISKLDYSTNATITSAEEESKNLKNTDENKICENCKRPDCQNGNCKENSNTSKNEKSHPTEQNRKAKKRPRNKFILDKEKSENPKDNINSENKNTKQDNKTTKNGDITNKKNTANNEKENKTNSNSKENESKQEYNNDDISNNNEQEKITKQKTEPRSKKRKTNFDKNVDDNLKNNPINNKFPFSYKKEEIEKQQTKEKTNMEETLPEKNNGKESNKKSDINNSVKKRNTHCASDVLQNKNINATYAFSTETQLFASLDNNKKQEEITKKTNEENNTKTEIKDKTKEAEDSTQKKALPDDNLTKAKYQDSKLKDEENKIAQTSSPLSDIAKNVIPSVVLISNYQTNLIRPTSEGSGIIYSSDGIIITNAHVVDNSKYIKVTLNNNETYQAELIGKDISSDLAVIKINKDNLVPINIGDSSNLNLCDMVIAIGNPKGSMFPSSVTVGYVSALNRKVPLSNGNTLTTIQTDCAINPGNSGGALIDTNGKLVGITSAKIVSSGYENIGFAISINDAKPILNDLIAFGKVKNRAGIGITYTFINGVLSSFYDLPQGLFINSIDNKDLIEAQVNVGDIITKIENKNVKSPKNLSELLKNFKPDDEISLTVFNPKSENIKEVKIKLIEI